MTKRTIRDLPLAGAKLLMRVDFNVPQESDGAISNDRRIRAALPTIKYALEKGASAILMSHLGRPKGNDPIKEPKLSLARVGTRLGELLPGVSVQTSPEVLGHTTTKLAGALKPGQVLLLENLRFDPREQKRIGRAKALSSRRRLRQRRLSAPAIAWMPRCTRVPGVASGTRVVGFWSKRN